MCSRACPPIRVCRWKVWSKMKKCLLAALPCFIQQVWPGTNGIFWFRKEVEVPAEWAGKDLTLSLGPVDDFDETYWNGELVGFGRLWSKPRVYTIPARMVRGGKAVVTDAVKIQSPEK